MSSEKCEANGYGHNLDLQSSGTNCMFHILHEVSAELRVTVNNLLTLVHLVIDNKMLHFW